MELQIDFLRRRKLFLYFAAAAAIIGFLTWGGFQLLNKNSGKKEIAEKVSIITKEKSDFSQKDQVINEVKDKAIADMIKESDEARNDAALEASKKTFAKLEISSNKRIKGVANFYFGENTLLGTTRGFNIADSSPANSETDNSENTSHRYFLVILSECQKNLAISFAVFPGKNRMKIVKTS
jgi:hypothetical protein